MKAYEQDYKICNNYGSMTIVNRGLPYEYKIGKYVSKDGYVEIYAEPKHICFTFYYLGRAYSQTLSEAKSFTDNQIIRMAGKFSRKIVNNNQ
jgi:hypothetical protein